MNLVLVSWATILYDHDYDDVKNSTGAAGAATTVSIAPVSG